VGRTRVLDNGDVDRGRSAGLVDSIVCHYEIRRNF
jgi:hypothetical protein